MQKGLSTIVFFSRLNNRQIKVGSRLIFNGLTVLETTPGVLGWRAVDESLKPGRPGQGLFETLTLDVDTHFGPALVHLLASSASSYSAEEGRANQQLSESLGKTYWPLYLPDLMTSRTEFINRTSAHAWLVQAYDWPSHAEERELVRRAGIARTTIGQVSAQMKLSPGRIRVAFLRAWLSNLLRFDIRSHSLSLDFEVCHA